jgi:hypothetical protein
MYFDLTLSVSNHIDQQVLRDTVAKKLRNEKRGKGIV